MQQQVSLQHSLPVPVTGCGCDSHHNTDQSAVLCHPGPRGQRRPPAAGAQETGEGGEVILHHALREAGEGHPEHLCARRGGGANSEGI